MAVAARSSSRAAATETRIYGCYGDSVKMKNINGQKSPCSVRVHGPMVVYLESRKIGDTRSRSKHESRFCMFDNRMKVKDRTFLRSYVACRDLIHRMLAEGPITGKYDLAADNWEDFKPHRIATTIVDKVRRDTEDRCGIVPAYAFDVEMVLKVWLIYSEPKALMLACKEAENETEAADDAFARSRKRRREPGGELCAICLWDTGMKDEESVRLPCSHAFHDRCIGPWFHRVSTCPTCQHDAVEHFDFVSSASAWAAYREMQATAATSSTAEEPQRDNAASSRRSKRAKRSNPSIRMTATMHHVPDVA